MVHGQLAGTLTENDNRTEYVFTYDVAYASQPGRESVCLAMPTDVRIYRSRHLFPFFANMLSEGENRATQAAIHHLDHNDDFGILLATACVDTPGAVTVKPL